MLLSRLTEVMEEKNISDAELAVKAMMSVRSVQNAKKGKGVSLNTGKRIAAVFKMKLDDLK